MEVLSLSVQSERGDAGKDLRYIAISSGVGVGPALVLLELKGPRLLHRKDQGAPTKGGSQNLRSSKPSPKRPSAAAERWLALPPRPGGGATAREEG